MKKRAIILLVLLVLFSLFCLVGSLWSLIGLIIVGFGFFQYIRKSKGLPSIRRPLIITWIGVLFTFILVLATIDTTETNKTASNTDAKVAAEKAEAEKESKVAAEKAKAEEEAKAAEKAKAEEEAKAAEKAKAEEEEAKVSNLAYDPFGPDRNCTDFSTGAEAQEFYIAAGGPSSDPHDLDRDNDGNACDWNP